MPNKVIYPWETPQTAPAAPPVAAPPPQSAPMGCAAPLEDSRTLGANEPLITPPAPPPAPGLPAAPAYVLAHALDSQVTLLWGESRQADGYLILRGTNPQSMRPIAAVEEPTYIDTQTQAGHTYYYTVRAYNEQGQSATPPTATVTLPASDESAETEGEAGPFAGKRLRVQRKVLEKQEAAPQPQAYAQPQPQPQPQAEPQPQPPVLTAPPPPTDLRADTHGTKFVALSWRGSAPDLEYRLYRSVTPWCCYGLAAETAETSYIDEVPDAATKYYYFVQAVRDGRSSEASAMAEAVTFPPLPAPETPTHLRANPHGPDAVELRWDHARGAAAYVVYARFDPNDEFRVIGHTLDDGYLHEELPQDAFIDYRVQAYHDSGASELSSVCTGRTGAMRTPPPRSSRPPQQPVAAQPGARRFPAFSLQSLQPRGMNP